MLPVLSSPWYSHIYIYPSLELVQWKIFCILSDICSIILRFYLAFFVALYIWILVLTIEVRQCPLTSGARGWSPAVPTDIWRSRLKSGRAHWDLELIVEGVVWGCRRRRRKEEAEAILIKSRDPHLAGGEMRKPTQKNDRSFLF